MNFSIIQIVLLRFGVDAALFILIWLVQVIIYPSFRYADVGQFDFWHSKYMGLITYFVGPLMLLQVGVIGWQLLTDYQPIYLLSAILIAIVWFTTATLSIPCHTSLQSDYDIAIVNRLVTTNWYRTISWTLVFLLSIWELRKII